jgi:hypothetical protein
MPTIQEISAKADELQVALDIEQQQVADLLALKEAAIASLTDTIAQLQVIVADGGTAADRQAVLDKLDATKTDLEGTVAP